MWMMKLSLERCKQEYFIVKALNRIIVDFKNFQMFYIRYTINKRNYTHKFSPFNYPWLLHYEWVKQKNDSVVFYWLKFLEIRKS